MDQILEILSLPHHIFQESTLQVQFQHLIVFGLKLEKMSIIIRITQNLLGSVVVKISISYIPLQMLNQLLQALLEVHLNTMVKNVQHAVEFMFLNLFGVRCV